MIVTRTLGLILLATYTLLYITAEHYVFIPIAAVAYLLAIREFIANRKDLKSAIYYSRIKAPLKETLISILVVALLMTLLYIVLYVYKLEYDNEMSVYLVLVLSATALSSWHQNFVNSIRSYENGIKLPDTKERTIDWNNIKELTRNNAQVHIKTNSREKALKIDTRDINDMDAIINNWKEKCL